MSVFLFINLLSKAGANISEIDLEAFSRPITSEVESKFAYL